MPAGRVVSVNVSDGGVPKRPVAAADVGAGGLAGDRQRDLRYHGGPDRAVCLYSIELITRLRAEGHPVDVGTMGENLTVAGVAWASMVPGAELRIGDVHLQVTAYAAPCSKIRGSFAGEEFARVSQEVHPGWSRVYARVLEPGPVAPGSVVQVVTGR